MDEELNKIVDTYYEDAPIIDTNEDSLETYNEVEIRRTEYNDCLLYTSPSPRD